jgi:Xaa-Pro aminopeptidase
MSKPILELHRRLSRLGVDALLFNTSEASASATVRYLSGFTGSDATLLLTPNERHLFTDGRYKIQVARQTTGFRTHVVTKKIDALAGTLSGLAVRRLGIEASRITYEFANALVRRVGDLQLIPLKREFLEGIRLRKTPEEKAIIQRAAEIASAACRDVIASGLSGKRETEVAGALETQFRNRGAEKIAFDTIVASGERSALPHGMASERVIGRGELVVIDYGCRVDGYHSDETVTAITGSPNPDQGRIHEVVYSAHMTALERVKPGIRARQLDGIAREVVEKAGFGRYFVHGLGHGVGLDIHEPPSLSQRGRGILDEGMVFTIEPGVYVEGIGGVRLESLVYLGSDGPQLLSQMPKDLICVE